MSLARHMAVMRNAPLLRALDEEALKLLAFASEPVNLKAKEVLFEAGEPADGAVLVLGGQLRLIAPTGTGSVRVAGVGHLVDELALVTPTSRAATGLAQASCETLHLPRTQMMKILAEYPAAAERLRAMISERTGRLLADLDALNARSFRR